MADIDLQIPGLYIICASQGSGKSHLIHYLMYKLRKKFRYGVIFSNTFFDNDPFPYVDSKYVHPEYDESVLLGLMKMQENMVKVNTDDPKNNKIRESFVIFDDCLDDPGQFNSEALRKLSIQLRHYHITVIFATQYCNLIPPRMRTNAMGVFMFKTDADISLHALFNNYGQNFDSFDAFRKYLMKNTGDYKFVYYNKFANGDIDDKYKVMRAPSKLPNFEIEFRTD